MADDFEVTQKAINRNRESLTKNIRVHKFFDRLRSKDVISYEDYQEIDNAQVNQTDVEKAGKLLDVIDTKGPNGQRVFLECLDEYYPHLFEAVTGQPSTPQPVATPPVGLTTHHPLIDLEGVRKLTAQVDELNRQHAADQLAISELREEVFKLRFVNTTCKAKLSKYPKLVERIKQMDLELKDLKEWQLNNIIKINNLEKETTKLKFERKEHKQTIDQLQLKLTDAVDMHQCQKHNWERTNSKNEQLAQDKNNLEKQLEHMQREIETVKRQSSLWSNKSFQISVDNTIQDPQAVIEILKMDLEESKNECKELVDRLYKERSDIEQREINYEMVSAEKEELQHMLGIVQKDLETTDRNYQLQWQELQRVSMERNDAYEQRDRSQAVSTEQRKERDRLQQRLNDQLMQFKHHLYDSTSIIVNGDSRDDDFLSPDLSRHKAVRVSGYSDTSGVSSGQASSSLDIGLERKSATLPNGMSPITLSVEHQRRSLQSKSRPTSDISNPETLDAIRPRTTPLTRHISNHKRQPTRNLFPEAEFPLSLDLNAIKKKEEQPTQQQRADAKVCQGGCVTPEDVANNFAQKPAHFADSTRSDLANRGSNKDKDYHKRVDLWIMRQSFKVRPPLDTSFSLDYDDEHDDLVKIFADDISAMADEKRRKKLKRRSRSLTDLTFSSDDSDEVLAEAGRRRPAAQRTFTNPSVPLVMGQMQPRRFTQQ